ncbi:MAG: InlB B-repeat-containing protein [Coriobacteriia bacterium]|nr:InlB B-repeat-containing protein [Coriobacteriia bacterium]
MAEGTAVSEPTAPTKAGFTFAGWWTDPTGGTLWDFSTPVTADMTLYAHWTPNEAPPTPDPTIPDTGDSIALFMPLIVALAGVAAAGTALNRKREQ